MARSDTVIVCSLTLAKNALHSLAVDSQVYTSRSVASSTRGVYGIAGPILELYSHFENLTWAVNLSASAVNCVV